MTNEQQYIERYWRDATPADAIKEPPMVARFRDGGVTPWLLGKLHHWARSSYPWVKENGYEYRFCQVYGAPDPGEGWRLIDTDKDNLQIGDEALLDTDDSRPKWETLVGNEVLGKRCIIRRRIEQPKPEPRYEPFRWEDREQLRGRWITYKHEDGTRIETQISHLSEHRLEGFWFKSRNPKWLLENATFLDTGEPVGRRVE